MRNYYQILGLDSNATKEEIKKAYRIYATKFHPDKQGGDEFFEERFKEIQEAYDILSDDKKRANYNLKFNQRFYNQNFSNNTYPSEDLKREREQKEREQKAREEKARAEKERIEKEDANRKKQEKKDDRFGCWIPVAVFVIVFIILCINDGDFSTDSLLFTMPAALAAVFIGTPIYFIAYWIKKKL